jgi:hypothetical protein
MAEYYCHICAIAADLLRPAQPVTITGSHYQFGKYLKHTVPGFGTDTVSLFDDPSYPAYEDYYLTTLASGGVEIDDAGRTNVVWLAGKDIG